MMQNSPKTENGKAVLKRQCTRQGNAAIKLAIKPTNIIYGKLIPSKGRYIRRQSFIVVKCNGIFLLSVAGEVILLQRTTSIHNFLRTIEHMQQRAPSLCCLQLYTALPTHNLSLIHPQNLRYMAGLNKLFNRQCTSIHIHPVEIKISDYSNIFENSTFLGN